MKTFRLSCRLWQAFYSPCSRLHTGASLQTMNAWQAYNYGTPDVLELCTTTRLPVLDNPADVLIQVEATSVNPIDIAMLSGYGAGLIKTMKCIDKFPESSPDFPLILGRDFVGNVVDCGRQVKGFKVGDKVWGALGVQRHGCHAEYVVACSSSIAKAPGSLPPEEAASLPYVALTARSAWLTAGSFLQPLQYLRALVLGGSGGVGTFAIQYLKVLGLEVTTTCSKDAEESMYKLGANFVVDYKAEDCMQRLSDLREFDFILDAAGLGTAPSYMNLLKANGFSKYVTLTSPVLKDTDRFGLLPGSALAASKAIQNTFLGLSQGKHVRWAFFVPSGDFLNKLAHLVDSGKIEPVVDRIFQFQDTKEAYCYVKSAHARGKTVITLNDQRED